MHTLYVLLVISYTLAPKAALPHCFANKSFHRETFKIDDDGNTGDEKCQLESNGSCCQQRLAAGAVSPPSPPELPSPAATTEYHQGNQNSPYTDTACWPWSFILHLQTNVWQCVSTPIKVVPAEQQGPENVPQTPDEDSDKIPVQDRFMIPPADTNRAPKPLNHRKGNWESLWLGLHNG